jgi:phenylalanyl-tRNA synthetase beta chain
VLDPEHTAISLANPLASDLAVMRTSLLPGLIGALRHNLARQQSRVRLFETGLVFYRGDGGETVQLSHLGAVLFGDALPEQWGTASRGVDFFDAKGDLEAILGLTGRESDFGFRAARHPALHPGRCAQVLDKGQGVGWIGALHPRAEKALDLGGAVYVFEMILASLTDARIPAFKEASRFPSIRRDIAIVVDEGISAESVRNCVAHAGGEWVRQVAHFDVYTGKGIDPGRKSLAIGLILQADSRTLTDSEVETVVQGVVARLEGELGATLRK